MLLLANLLPATRVSFTISCFTSAVSSYQKRLDGNGERKKKGEGQRVLINFRCNMDKWHTAPLLTRLYHCRHMWSHNADGVVAQAYSHKMPVTHNYSNVIATDTIATGK